MVTRIKVGTRRSALAKTQTQWVVGELKSRGIECEIREIVSEGDREKSKPLYEIESSGPGLFTKQLELALQSGEIDLAVHSLKDLPTLQPPDLKVWAVPMRELCHDVVVCSSKAWDPQSPWGLRPGSSVGTSSLRREALLLWRAQLNVRPVRGNVPTRVRAVESGELDAVVLAQAGLNRLQLKFPPGVVCHALDNTDFVSAPGQGALAIEGRTDLPVAWRQAVESLNHLSSAEAVKWERHILRELEGGCTLPLGVRCRNADSDWEIFVFLGVNSGSDTARRWTGFHHRSWKGSDPGVLAQNAISHFRGVLGLNQ
jgi:hydroxymethylbilane synthase